MAVLCILGKVVPEKLFSFFIKNFWIKLFKNIQFFNHLLYSVSYFETRTSNGSDFEPFFHNSTNFESKFLERFRFWNKRFYNASDFELNLIFLTKNRFWWKFCFQKITFGSFYTKKRQFLQLSVFSETNNCLKNWKKNIYPIKTFAKNLILKQVFNSASDSNQDFQNKSVFSQF